MPDEPEPVETAPLTEDTPLETLKEVADNLGLKYHPSIGPGPLLEKIKAAQNGDSE